MLFSMLMVLKTICSYGGGHDAYSFGDLSAVVHSCPETHRPATDESVADGLSSRRDIQRWTWVTMKTYIPEESQRATYENNLEIVEGQRDSYKVSSSTEYAGLDLDFFKGGVQISNPSHSVSFIYSFFYKKKCVQKATLLPGQAHRVSLRAGVVKWCVY
jgi:hypothetical protein